MFAYKPGLDLFICTLYHTPTAMPFVFLNSRSGCFGLVGGKADSGSLSPSPLQLYLFFSLKQSVIGSMSVRLAVTLSATRK